MGRFGGLKICIYTSCISFTIIPDYPLTVRTMLVYDANVLSLTCYGKFLSFVFSRDAEVSCIDDEFNTVDDILQGP